MAKFLLITHIYPPAVDGGSKVISKMGDYFKKNNHQIMVLTSDANSTDDFTHKYRVTVPSHHRAFGLPVYTFFHRPLKKINKVLAKGPIFKLVPFIKFLIACIKFRPDYIIAGPLPTTIVLYANFIKKITRAKLIINASFHENDLEFHHPWLIKSLQSADFIWTLTDYETKYFKKHFFIPLSKMINVGNGIDSDFLNKSIKQQQRTANLLFVGSFAAHKGLETLFKAFSLLPKKYSLTIAGKPTLYKLEIPKNVKVITNFKSEELGHLLDQSSILISPSTQESFGLVLLEAMARGVPVIAANIPASSEIVKKSKSGLLFEVNNPQDLAKKIIKLSESKSFNKYRINGISFASTHTWDKIGETIWQKIQSS